MKRAIVGLVLTCLAGVAAAAQSAQTQPASAPRKREAAPRPPAPDFTAQYGVVVSDNMFVRDRGHPSPPPSAAPTTQPAPPSAPPAGAEQSLVLIGVVQDGEDMRAFVEDVRDGSMLRVASGDAVARGRVGRVVMDAIEYELNGSATWIEVGQDLTGAVQAPPPIVATSQPAATTAPATASAASPAPVTPPPNPATSSVEEMMRRRRQQMMKGR